MRYECCAGGTTCNDLPAAGNLEDVLSHQQIQGKALVGVKGAKPWWGKGGKAPLTSRDPTAYTSTL